jgi:UDP-sugar transporter A1/2/3
MGDKFGMSFRSLILGFLLLQNSGYTLLRKFSTMTEDVSAKEILLVGEFIKFFFSIYVITGSKETSDAPGAGLDKLVWLLRRSLKMLVLAVIYLSMNILSFVALHYIGAGEFTVCAQLKILSTAGFSVLILGTSLSPVKWRALLLLVLSCILVASPDISHTPSAAHASSGDPSSVTMKLLGYFAVLVEVALSGAASIYFEKFLKSSTEVITVWERNFQLSFYSIIIYSLIIIYENHDPNLSREAWSNWSFLTFLVSVLGAAGGLLVAATLKYADSILKTLATSGAIVISTILGHFFLSGPMDLTMVIGSMCTIIAIFNYTMDTT